MYYDGQLVSYPNLLAQQFQLIGGGEFKQPLMPMSSVGFGAAKNSKYTLAYVTDCKNVTSLSPIAGVGDFNALAGVDNQGPFNNMGVPGAKAITTIFPGYGDPLNGYGNYNPFFARMVNATGELLPFPFFLKQSNKNQLSFLCLLVTMMCWLTH